jgi:hypothetical protein
MRNKMQASPSSAAEGASLLGCVTVRCEWLLKFQRISVSTSSGSITSP